MSHHIDVPTAEVEPLDSILNVLRLTQVASDRFRGTSLAQFGSRVYGGQVFAQAVLAAQATMLGATSKRQIHSITAAFLRPGDVDKPIDFLVEDVLDGNSFSTRRIHALQDDLTIFSARASFQETQAGIEHYSHPPLVPSPADLPSSVDFFASVDVPEIRQISMFNLVDLRHVDGAIWVKPQKEKTTRTQIWFRLRNEMPANATQLLHRAMLAYATDHFMLEPVMRAHGLFWIMPKVALATLDHTIWWHRDVDVSQWILADLDTPSAQGGRGLSIAKFYQNGTLIATMSQEGMVRAPLPV